ncbi:MAG: hypothetical protein ACK5MN_10235 [Lachnospiraceae bacterium]
MTSKATSRKPMYLVETVFDIVYLLTVFIASAMLCLTGRLGSVRFAFGGMGLLLGVGDSFHLVPRLLAMWDTGDRDYAVSLGRGKQIASVTMTVFYVILWQSLVRHYTGLSIEFMSGIVYLLATVRIVLCFFRQNHWNSKEQPLTWGIWRNLPFAAIGALVVWLAAAGALQVQDGLSFLWLAVLISFACYLPVVLFVGKNPKLGMLMLPKSCAYAAIILMGFSLPIQ